MLKSSQTDQNDLPKKKKGNSDVWSLNQIWEVGWVENFSAFLYCPKKKNKCQNNFLVVFAF